MKKVTFREYNDTYVLVVWSFAYRESRKKYWELFAVDRIHFQRHINHLSKIISPILDKAHRCRIYNERFIK